MKYLSLLLLLLLGQIAWANPKDAKVITVTEASDWQNQIEASPDGIIFFIPAHTSLNLELKLSGDIASLASTPSKLTFGRDLYFYAPPGNEEPKFSWDNKRWKKWDKLFSGSFGAGFSQPGDIMELKLQLEAKRK